MSCCFGHKTLVVEALGIWFDCFDPPSVFSTELDPRTALLPQEVGISPCRFAEQYAGVVVL